MINWGIHYKMFIIFIASCAMGFNFTHQEPDSQQQSDDSQVFERVPSSHSHITFSNDVQEDVSTRENLFDFDFFYNGSGVGVADINNDGLQDIFFTSNQQKNTLYLNKGNLQFEDITEKAGINIGKQWSNGVTFADVNADGFLDIYISQGGPKGSPTNGIERRNLLYINQGDLTFKQQAVSYGLADEGISTQSVFFDFDQDGDLDCLVGNENYLFGMEPNRFYQTLDQRPDLLHMSSSHLYRNEGGRFVDITAEAGLLRPGFSLGVSVSDLNNDGWLDIYFANDYYVPDYTYINQGDGTFTEENKERFKQTSFYGMGVDIADINNDGLQDIFVLDMASSDHYRSKTLMRSMNVDNFRLLVNQFKFNFQYMFNSLQLNIGDGNYQNIVHFSGTAKTDWSWAGLIADYDQDGYKDIYVTNGYRRYALDNDLQNAVADAQEKYRGQVPLDVKQELYNQMPTEKLRNYMFHNQTDLSFKNQAQDWGLGHKSYSNGAAYADLDNDGDLELIVNNIDEEAFLYKNNSVENKVGNFLTVEAIGNQSESFAKVYLKYKGQTQLIETSRVRGYLSSMPNIAHFGLGKTKTIDTVRVEWPSGKYEERYRVKGNRKITFYESEVSKNRLSRGSFSDERIFNQLDHQRWGLNFTHKENAFDDFAREILLPYQQSTMGPFITKGDINGDGLEDIFVGGASGQAGKLFIQNKSGFEAIENRALNADAVFEDMEAVLEDFDKDGDLDLFVVSGGNAYEESTKHYKDRLYWNDGQGIFTKAVDTPFEQESFSGKAVCTIDFDQDGDQDLIVGNRIVPQNYPKYAPSRVYQNEGGKFVEKTGEVAPELSQFGIINQIIRTDFDADGWEDLIVVGEWTHIGLFKNNQGIFTDISAQSSLDQAKGWWFSVGETDINQDGLNDYIIGNLGLNSKYQASKEKPFIVFANDFDANGSLDIVLSKKSEDGYLPVRGRECSSQQMPFIADKFPTYHEFASASLDDIYGVGLNQADKYEATEFASILLLNKGGGTFEKVVLPSEAQLLPLMNMTFFDVNKDGFEDAIIAGNIYGTEVETPRLDAMSGLVMLSNGQDNYSILDYNKSGLYLDGNIKDIELINHERRDALLVIGSKNDGELEVYQVSDASIER